MTSSEVYQLPERKTNSKGMMRKIGIEIEFAGIDTLTATRAIMDAIGGKQVSDSKHMTRIEGTEIGDLKIELDTQYVHPKSVDEPQILQDGREFLGSMVTSMVPQELVTEPIAIDQLHLIDKATDALTRAGGTGTDKSILHAFGLHLNPEIASEDGSYLLALIRAIIIMDQELHETLAPDLTRRTLGWAQSYTPQYELHVMNPDYKPDKTTLITDYIAMNKGRNHHLDMLPVFAFLNGSLVQSLLSDTLVSARPAFHFRLPDSRIGDREWTVRNDWNFWVKLENFANTVTENEIQNWHNERTNP
jgi:hypothetical protein